MILRFSLEPGNLFMTPNGSLSNKLLFCKNTFIIILIIYILQKTNLNKARLLDSLTARQYGEVVLPDEASGNCPGTRRQASHITVPVQGGYGAVFAIMVQGFLGSGAIAVQC